MDLSIVIPVYNEEESLEPLMQWIKTVVDTHDLSAEVIFVDDGSSDTSWRVIQSLRQTQGDIVKGIRFRRNYGKSAALNEGFEQTKGSVVITMDADLQDSPEEIPALYKMIHEEGFDVVSGWKKKRHDPITKRWPSKLFNGVASRLSRIKLHDFNCGLKAYRSEVVKDISLYGDMHRWIPVLAKWAGYERITEKIVEHHPRKFGVSKFGAKRLISGFLDLLTIFFVGKFNKRPMHFFGTWGIVSLFFGIAILSYLGVMKLFNQVYGIQDRPLFFLGMILLLIGSQLFLTGFLAELLVSNRSQKGVYNISERI